MKTSIITSLGVAAFLAAVAFHLSPEWPSQNRFAVSCGPILAPLPSYVWGRNVDADIDHIRSDAECGTSAGKALKAGLNDGRHDVVAAALNSWSIATKRQPDIARENASGFINALCDMTIKNPAHFQNHDVRGLLQSSLLYGIYFRSQSCFGLDLILQTQRKIIQSRYGKLYLFFKERPGPRPYLRHSADANRFRKETT